ncbi:MAG: 4'-phosphopantetheinyl transferase superfamily protein [Elusimicrobiaceae bacterium]|nr:4'-phosphopantetheinyl transferase superfamily protein [Elusimicrobiaceae bacterium]
MPYQVKVVDLSSLPPADGILSEREGAFYQTLRFPKRRTEWLGGRFALKTLVAQILQLTDLREIEVLPQADGKPTLAVHGQESPLSFSITHSHGYAVAAVSQTYPLIGIDLERIEKRIDAWARDFFHSSEITGEGEEFLTALWTQKEALVKLLGTGLSLNSYEVRCVNGSAQFFDRAAQVYNRLGSPEITLKTEGLVPGFMFSVALGKPR